MAAASDFAFHATRCAVCTTQHLCPKGTELYELTRATSAALADAVWHTLGDMVVTAKMKAKKGGDSKDGA